MAKLNRSRSWKPRPRLPSNGRAAIGSVGRRSSIRIRIPVASSPSSDTQPTNSPTSNNPINPEDRKFQICLARLVPFGRICPSSAMYIESVPNRNSPPAILLRESYRENGKVRKRTLCNLSDWPVAHIEGLRGVLRGGTVIAAEREAFTVLRTLPHGHVAAALGTARKIGLDRVLGADGDRWRDLILALLVSRILDPASKLATARALSPGTASSSLGEMLRLGR